MRQSRLVVLVLVGHRQNVQKRGKKLKHQAVNDALNHAIVVKICHTYYRPYSVSSWRSPISSVNRDFCGASWLFLLTYLLTYLLT